MGLVRSRLTHLMASPLFWLACLYIVVGVAYALVTPALEKLDEEGHYGYALYVREHHSLPPVLAFEGSARASADFPRARQPASRAELALEFQQPPLYYVITAIASSWLPNDPEPDVLLTTNPYVTLSVPGYRNDNRNYRLHPPDLTPLILTGRLVSLLFGLGTMLASYFFAAQLFPKKTLVPIATAAIVGFQPTFLFVATAVSDDSAIAFFGALTIAILAYRLRKGPFVGTASTLVQRLGPPLPTALRQLLSWAWFPVLLGAVLGLAILTKASGLVFFPLVGLALILIHRGLCAELVRDGVIIICVAFAIGGWWYVRDTNVVHDLAQYYTPVGQLPSTNYTDPRVGAAPHVEITNARVLMRRLKGDLSTVEYTFWANQTRVFVSPIGFDHSLIGWGRISLGLLMLGIVLNWRTLRGKLPVGIILLSWPVTFLCLLIFYWNPRTVGAHGRFLFPSLAPLTLLLVWGWQTVMPPQWRRLALTLCAGMVIVIGSLMPFASLYSLFHPSREWQARQVEYSTGITYADAATGMPVARLIGYNLPQPYAAPGKYFPVELCWESLGKTKAPYSVFLHLLDDSQLTTQAAPTIWGARQTYPGLGNRPTDRWALHSAFCDTVLVQAAPNVPTPLGVAIEVGFVDPANRDRLQAVNVEGTPIDLAIVGRVPILSPQDLPVAKRAARYTLDDAIGLNDAQLSAADSSITLTLTWQSLHTVPYDATTFVHLRGADGSILAQVDRQPLNGRFPTSLWLPGQIVTDTVNLSLPSGTQSGPLVLNLGMYTWPSLQRLAVMDASGHPQRDNMIVVEVPISSLDRQ